jgi:hypothetical protein
VYYKCKRRITKEGNEQRRRIDGLERGRTEAADGKPWGRTKGKKKKQTEENDLETEWNEWIRKKEGMREYSI